MFLHEVERAWIPENYATTESCSDDTRLPVKEPCHEVQTGPSRHTVRELQQTQTERNSCTPSWKEEVSGMAV
jgi:hypothetical protein